jgi:hypothetical protein
MEYIGMKKKSFFFFHLKFIFSVFYFINFCIDLSEFRKLKNPIFFIIL